jgi:hypothetical protein
VARLIDEHGDAKLTDLLLTLADCIGKLDSHDPTLPLILEARTIRAPHQDEPRIGQSRRGGWVMRASFAPRLTTTPMLEVERKASRFCTRPAIVVNCRISDRPVSRRGLVLRCHS